MEMVEREREKGNEEGRQSKEEEEGKRMLSTSCFVGIRE